MHPKTDERRTHPRIKPPYPLFVDCPLPKKVRDISVKGAYVEDSDPLPTGHKLHLLFKQEKSRPVALRGVIRRAELRRGMGVEFVDTAPERANHLKRLLNMTTQGLAGTAAATAESAQAASEESADAASGESVAASAGGAEAASAGINLESGLGEIPSFIDDGYRPPPPPEPEAEAEEPPPSPKTNPLLFYAVLIVAFITAFALGLAFLLYTGRMERAPAAAAPPPITETPAPIAETRPPKTETVAPPATAALPPRAETPAPIAESPASKAETPAPKTGSEAPPAAAVAAKPEAQPPTTAGASATIPQTPAATRGTPAGFAVQVGAYEERSKSEALARRVSTFYQGAVVVAPAQVHGKTYYRVHLPVGTRKEAKQLAARLAKEQKIEAWVRPLP